MKVTINGQEIDVFSGARVQDAVRLYSPLELAAVKKNDKKVFDRWGNEVGLDGELSSGEQLQIK